MNEILQAIHRVEDKMEARLGRLESKMDTQHQDMNEQIDHLWKATNSQKVFKAKLEGMWLVVYAVGAGVLSLLLAVASKVFP